MKVRRQRLRQVERRISALEARLTPGEVSVEIAPKAIDPEEFQKIVEITRRKGDTQMDKQFFMEALEKQVQLLSECSTKCVAESDAIGLAALTEALLKLSDAVGLIYA